MLSSTLLLGLALGMSAAVGATPEKIKRQEGGPFIHTLNALSEVVLQAPLRPLEPKSLSKRQSNPTQVKNNVAAIGTISPGQVQYYLFPASELESPQSTATPILPPSTFLTIDESTEGVHQELKRQTQQTLYLSLSICSQPSTFNGQTSGPQPNLSLYVSKDSSNKNPGPNYQGTQQLYPVATSGGLAKFSESQSGDTYFSVSAPQVPDSLSGNWTYQVTASSAAYYSDYNDWPALEFADSDPTSAFFVTSPLANATNNSALQQQWLGTGAPFGVFIYDANDPTFAGINQSYCGLSTYAQAKANLQGLGTEDSQGGMRVHKNTYPYQQIYVGSLNKSSSYLAQLALPSNYSLQQNTVNPGGGGLLWKSIDFTTRSTDNCKLIYNLSFCNSIAYAVPTNGTLDLTDLAGNYDNYTSSQLWPNFRNSLDQIPCNTSADAKYSLARDCDDCQAAYKAWVCAISIPRCADYSSTASFLQVRNTQGGNWPNGTSPDQQDPVISNATNFQARNANLSSFVNNTGPYKEVLPCIDLCHNLVQSCPSILGFVCPYQGRGLEWSYGTIPQGQNLSFVDGYPVCNIPGAMWGASGVGTSRPSLSLMLVTLGGLALVWL